MRTLDYFLTTVGVSPGFEVLVIDVEGLEWEVLLGFSALRWQPRVVIVEIEDTHESFRDIDFLQARASHPRRTAHGSLALLDAYGASRLRVEWCHSYRVPQERYRRVRGYFQARGYREHWRDHINTVFARD